MYQGWVKQSEDEFLPVWLTSNLKDRCDCGYEMENFYNPDGHITKRRCSNPVCPHKLALKIVGMCNILQVKGIGEATGLKIVNEHNLTNHFAALPFILKEKPSVTLYMYLRMAFIEGIDKSWSEVTEKFTTLEDIFSSYRGNYRRQIDANKELLQEGLQYVDLQEAWKPKHEPLIRGTVMISGNLRGWTNRNDFINGINMVTDGYVQLTVAESKRKTGVLALIQEADTPNRGKAECALENGIPIKTPDEFKKWIIAELQKKLVK